MATEPTPAQTAAAAAAEAMTHSQMEAFVTAPGEPSEVAATVFPRDSVERRVLGAINEGPHKQMGSRNTLHALTDYLATDSGTVNPPAGMPRLQLRVFDEQGTPVRFKGPDELVTEVLGLLEKLIAEGLVDRVGELTDPAHSYQITDAGVGELQAGSVSVLPVEPELEAAAAEPEVSASEPVPEPLLAEPEA